MKSFERLCFTPNTLFFSESFRCGVFFAGKEFKDKPFEKLFIIPKRFPINQTYYNSDSEAPKKYSDHGACPIAKPYGTVDNPSVHNDTCYNIVSTMLKHFKKLVVLPLVSFRI